ncbi:MAG: trehalose-6-phosphate synthase [Candidatus Korobacteraceae bacterium]
MNSGQGRLIVVSNRLPVNIEGDAGQRSLFASSGGLVTALQSVLRTQKVVWVGWPGAEDDGEVRHLLQNASEELPYSFEPIFLSPEQVAGFYSGFSNEIVWPLFHDLQSRCRFDPSYWQTYIEVNRKFAETVARMVTPQDFVWVHDYHLMLVGRYLREAGVESTLGFFQHIPFPPPDIFEKLPWRSEILKSLLEFNVVGLQTLRDRRNFNACMRTLAPGVQIHRNGERFLLEHQGRRCVAGNFAISIDFSEFSDQAASPEATERAAKIKEEMGGKQIVLGVDRLDYTKGIPERLRAYLHLFHHYPELRRRLALVQIVVPSREDLDKYKELKLEIEGLVSRINGELTEPGWIPIHYLYRHLSRLELLAYYRAADIALITPLKDGMNLVAKEFCASQVDENGVLILSEFAGAAPELKQGAMLVNPYDTEGVAETLSRAFHMTDERRSRMRRLRDVVRRNDVYRWADSFLLAAAAVHLPRIAKARSLTRQFEPQSLLFQYRRGQQARAQS